MIDLSILIVNWNTREFTQGCLSSLLSTSDRLENGRLVFERLQAEVIVVDNGSHDGSAALIREEFPWATLIQNDQNLGFAPANNQAYRISSGRYLLLLNSDTRVQDGALQALVDFMDAHPDCG